MKLVLGLGNDGPEYRFTRHNVGFMVVDVLAGRCGCGFRKDGALGRLAYVAEARLGDHEALLAKPRTLMNRSGQALSALLRAHDLELGDVVVVYDDADLSLGRVRVRSEGGAGGHNGVRSLMDAAGTGAFARVKLGVLGEDRYRRDLADYVLDVFHPDERAVVAAMVEAGADAVGAILESGVEAAQRAFNGPPAPPRAD